MLDGPANTLLLVEAKTAIPWTKPEDLDYSPDKPLPPIGGYDENGVNVLIADGSVRFLGRPIDERLIRGLASRDGMERIEDQKARQAEYSVSPEIAEILAESGQSEAEFKMKLHTVLSQAASIPNAQWEDFATDPHGSTAGIQGEPLSHVLLTLNPIQASEENPDVLNDFRMLTTGFPKPTALHKAMSPSQPHGYVSIIQPEYIKTTSIDIDAEEKVFRGSVEFEAPDLYRGSRYTQ
jgi:hypothetical protein